MNQPEYPVPAVYTPTAAVDPFAGAFPAYAPHLSAPLPVQVAAGTPMTVTTVMLPDGRSVLGYVPAPTAPVTIRPAYRPGADPVVMRSLSGGALLAGGGVAAWGAGGLFEGLGAFAESLGRMAAGSGGVVIVAALAFGLVRSLGGSFPGTGTGTSGEASGGTGGGTSISKHVVTGPQQIVHARRVRIKNMIANHSVDL